MPYHLVKSGKGWKVARKDTGKTFSEKPLSRGAAEKQIGILYMAARMKGEVPRR